MNRIDTERVSPIFRTVAGAGAEYVSAGLTLRDWFAGQALSGMLNEDCFTNPSAEDLAKWSYEIANAMLKEREK